MKEVTHAIQIQVRRRTDEEYRPERRMRAGKVSRGKLLGRFKDCDRLAEHEGAPTLLEAYEPIKGDPFYDRIYRDPKYGGTVEVWCRAQPIAEIPGLTIDSLPHAADLFKVTPKATPLQKAADTPTEPEIQATLF